MGAQNVSRETPTLSDAQHRQLAELLELLLADGHAPTAIREMAAAEQVHVADSLAALELDVFDAPGQLADLGSGAGFPGLALAVARPQLCVSVVESNRRKCEFARRAIEAAGIENALVVCSRAEQWSAGLSHNDVVTARALAPQPVVLEYAAPLLRIGGTLVDWRGRRVHEDEQAADRAAGILGMHREEVRRVVPFEGARDRHLHVFVKGKQTPARFPRRAGIARKRPLGA